ncbi:MAG: alpha/beta hydrolase [Steroidobacteraceae bacterium]|jgi:pimeloyl-ACP methyl ester carboxylesterase
MSNETNDYFYPSADGLKLYCRIYPAQQPGGTPILCLPGLTRNSRDFVALARHLQPRHEVLTADLRGRGLSDRDSDPSRYQLPNYVRDIWSLLDSRGMSRVVVVGTSLGGLMGMVMAATRPANIAGLVLNDAGPEIDRTGVRRIAGYAGKLPPVSSWAEAAAQAKSVYGLALPGLTDADWLGYARCGYHENANGVPVPDVDPKISEAFKNTSAAAPDMWPLYAQIKGVPMLVIRGALSDILSAATVARMAREKPDLMHIEVANRGHTPLLNEPQCVTAIDAFVAQHGEGAA